MTDSTLATSPAAMHREIRAWIDYYAHALPRPARDLEAAIDRLVAEALRRLDTIGADRTLAIAPHPPSRHAPAEVLTAAMILDAIDRRAAETLALDAGAPGHVAAVVQVLDTVATLRRELGLEARRDVELPWPAWEAASDIFDRWLAGRAAETAVAVDVVVVDVVDVVVAARAA